VSARLRRAVIAAIAIIGLSLAGCSTSSSKLDASVSAEWQARVVSIADLAAAGDPAGALQELATLEADTAQAEQAGVIDGERAATIQQSIAMVRADLEAAVAAIPVPEPVQTEVAVTESPTPGSDDDGNSGNNGNDDKGNDNKGSDDKGNDDKGSDGKGNGKGNERGNGKQG